VDARATIERVGASATFDHVIAITAVDGVVATHPEQQVVAAVAVDHIGIVGADDEVVALAAFNVLDAEISVGADKVAVAIGDAAVENAGKRAGEINQHAIVLVRIIGRIDAVATVVEVGAGAAGQSVVAVVAVKLVVTTTA